MCKDVPLGIRTWWRKELLSATWRISISTGIFLPYMYSCSMHSVRIYLQNKTPRQGKKWDTLTRHEHQQLNQTLPYPCVNRFLQSYVGKRRVHWVVCTWNKGKDYLPAESTKNNIFISANTTASTTLLFSLSGILYLGCNNNTLFSTWCNFPSGLHVVTSVSYLFPYIFHTKITIMNRKSRSENLPDFWKTLKSNLSLMSVCALYSVYDS